MIEPREVPRHESSNHWIADSLESYSFPAQARAQLGDPVPETGSAPEISSQPSHTPRSEKTIEPVLDRASMRCESDKSGPLDTLVNTSYVLLARIFPGLNAWAEAKLLHPGFHGAKREDLLPGPFEESLNEGFLDAPGGAKLHYWHAPAREGRPTVVFSHGNGGNLMECEPIFGPLVEQGYGVMTYDYRGYGHSTGKASEQGLYQDLDAVVGHLEAAGIERSEQILLGFSYGTAVTVDVASRTDTPFKAVLLLAPMTSSPEVFQFRVKNELPSWLAPIFLPFSERFEQLIDSGSKIHKISSPLVVLHGTADPIVPPYMGEKLIDGATAARSRTLVWLTGVGHNEIVYPAAPIVMQEIDKISR